MHAFKAGLFAAVAASAWAVDWPSSVVPDPLMLPSPGGKPIEFIPVRVSEGDSAWGPREFRTGTSGDSPFESPPSLTVEGSFHDTRQKSWFYYISRTEVTVALFNAVMRSAGRPGFLTGVEEMPATGLTWLQVQEFLAAYNSWISKKSGEELPHEEGRLKAYLRLPTESEWEFAARGGLKVSPEVFAARTPYGEEPIELFEWVGGPTSSHNKLQPVAKLRPNALGVHDLLGNASEMTETTFQLYGEGGKTGGGVRKGGNFRTKPQDARTSLRGEFPRYSLDGENRGNPDLGFRLVLASLVFADVETVTQIAGGKIHPASVPSLQNLEQNSADVATSEPLTTPPDTARNNLKFRQPSAASAPSTLISLIRTLQPWHQATILALAIVVAAFLPGLLFFRGLKTRKKHLGRTHASAMEKIGIAESKSRELSCVALAESLCKAIAELFGAPEKLSYPYKSEYDFLATANAMLSCGSGFGLVLPGVHTQAKLAEFLKTIDALKFAPRHLSEAERTAAIHAAKELVQRTRTT